MNMIIKHLKSKNEEFMTGVTIPVFLDEYIIYYF